MSLTRVPVHPVAALLILAGSVGSASAQVTLQTVALTARADVYGPGLGVATFSDLSGTGFSINNNGEVTFRGSLGASNSGIWRWNGAGNTAQVQTGEASPAGGAFLNSFNMPIRNDAGQWTFREGAGATAKIFADFGSGLSLIARGSDPVPGLTGVTYSNIGTPSPGLSSAGHIPFPVSFAGAGIVISGATANSSAIMIASPSGVPSIALRQNDSTGIADIRIGTITGTSLPLAVNDSGRFLTVTALQGGAVVTGAAAGNDQGLFSNRSGSLEMIAQRGSSAAGALDGANYRVISAPDMNNSGRIAFTSTLRDGSIPAATTTLGAVFTDASGSLAMIARGGATMPASTGFASHTWGNTFGDVAINNAGHVVFRDSGISGPGISANVNDSVVITADAAGNLSTVMQVGTQAADLAAGVNYGGLNSGLAINAQGQVLFNSALTGAGVVTGPNGNNQGLFATDPNGLVHMIVRKGVPFEVAPGEFRTPTNIASLGTTGGNDARPLGINDNGQVVFGLTFGDGTSGIFVATVVPTPGAAVLAALSTIAMTTRRRRRA